MNTIPIEVRPFFSFSEFSSKYIQTESSPEKNANFIEDISFENKQVKINPLYYSELKDRETKINSLLEKIIKIKNNDCINEEIEPPSPDVFYEAESLIILLAERNFFPFRISESAEGGLCFYFKNNSRIFYFEIYNDGDKGFIIEDTINKKIIKNLDIEKFDSLIDELVNFYA